ncbi:sugar-binding protein [Microbacterium sp. NPDC016588]
MSSSRTLRVRLVAAATAAGLALAGLLAVPAVAVDGTISVEGEAPTSTNMTPGSTAQTGASGGRSLWLHTLTEAPSGGYLASYDIEIPADGAYTIDATAIYRNVGWASPFEYSIDGGAFQPISSAIELGTVSNQLKTYRLGAAGLAAGTATITFKVTQRRVEPDTRYTFFVDRLQLTPTDRVWESLAAPAVLGVFEHGTAATLTASANVTSVQATPATWRLTDYGGDEIATGSVTIPAGGRSVSVPFGSSLPTGYYRATVESEALGPITTGFVVVPDAASRPSSAGSPFAADVYGSGLIDPQNVPAFARALRLSGVEWIRDRQSWNDRANPAQGQFDFAYQTRARAWLEAASDAGLKTLSTFHHAPTWSDADGRKLPQDLRDAYRFAKAVGEEYDGLVDGWQIWNEQNRFFATSSEAPENYAGVLKAAALGFADSGADAQLVTGGLAGVDPHYARQQFRNDVLSYVDGYAYHTHTTDNYLSSIDAHPDFSSQLDAAEPFGGEEKGRWVSEAGIALSTGNNSTLPDETQARAQARYIVTSAVESLHNGSTRHFFFIGAPYREGSIWWSSFRTATEPMPAVAAQSVLTAQLPAASAAGRVDLGDAETSAYAFDTAAGEVVVAWAPTARAVHVPGSAVTAVDLMGHDVAVTAESGGAAVTIGPDPIYLRGSSAAVTAQPTTPVTQAPSVIDTGFDAAHRIVVQPRFSATASASSQTHGYAMSASGTNRVDVDVYNFGSATTSVVLEALADGGWTVSGASTVSVPAGGMQTIPLDITASADLTHSASELRLTPVVGAARGSTSVAELRPSVIDVRAAHAVDGSADVVEVSYTNHTGAARAVSAVEWTLGASTSTSTPAPSVVVAPGSTTRFRSPDVAAGSGPTAYAVVVRFSDGGSARTTGTLASLPRAGVEAVAERTIVADGVLDDLTGVASQKPTGPGVDPDTLDADVWFTWDDDNLYLTASVHDDVHRQTDTGTATWRGDSIQFGVASGWPGESLLRPEVQDSREYTFALTSAGPQLYRQASYGVPAGSVSAATIAVTRDDAADRTVYEAAIPWGEFPGLAPSGELAASLSIAINDVDAGALRGWVQWGGGITTDKDTQNYRPVRWADSPGPQNG